MLILGAWDCSDSQASFGNCGSLEVISYIVVSVGEIAASPVG